MVNFHLELSIILSIFIGSVINILSTKCEDNVFRIRKCCAANELILESTGRCIENKLLNVDSHFYRHANETDEDGNEIYNNGLDETRPWWFPPQTEIISRRTEKSLTEFPKKYQVISGKGQPCAHYETSFLPDYFYKYNFYDDGSIAILSNHTHQSTRIRFDPLSFCIDRLDIDAGLFTEEYEESILHFAETLDYTVKLCPCSQATCILKCCGPGMSLSLDSGNCVKNYQDDWIPVYSKEGNNTSDYFILYDRPHCKTGESLVIPNYSSNNDPGYIIFSNGTARVKGETYMNEALQFCGDNLVSLSGNKTQNRILRCYPKYGIKSRWSEIKRIFYGWLFVVGAVFLFVTLVVHSCIPSMKKLNDKSLISQTWSLFIGYVSIAVSQLSKDSLPQGLCVFLGFLIQYSFLCAFFWLNVLCFDISNTFRFLKIPRCRYKRHTRGKQIFYFCYGWLCPAAVVLITVIIDFNPDISHYLLKPGIIERCWFKKDSFSELIYFYGPISILLAVNLFLFLYTSFKIMQAQNDISSTIRSHNVERQRFLLYLKLFILMGLSWITELISWAVGGPEYYWFIPDTVNLLRAIFIFIIICWKKQVFDELKKKMGLRKTNNIRRPSNTKSSSI